MSMCSLVALALATLIKILQTGGLNSRHLFLTVLEAGKSKIKESADAAFVQGPLPGLQMATI